MPSSRIVCPDDSYSSRPPETVGTCRYFILTMNGWSIWDMIYSPDIRRLVLASYRTPGTDFYHPWSGSYRACFGLTYLLT